LRDKKIKINPLKIKLDRIPKLRHVYSFDSSSDSDTEIIEQDDKWKKTTKEASTTTSESDETLYWPQEEALGDPWASETDSD